MNTSALVFAIVGAVVTFIGFGFARKFDSQIVALLIKIVALGVGFASMPVLESMMKVEGASAAGAYWVYILVGAWVISKLFGGSGKLEK